MRIITLRSAYKTLSVSEVQSMPNVSIREKHKWGFEGHSTIKHYYNLATIKGKYENMKCNVVVDKATGLMWHQSGSDYSMTWKKAKKWIKRLNSRLHTQIGVFPPFDNAGYNDWRLPTVEEAASLLALRGEYDGSLLIDPIFSDKQWCIWTGDEQEHKMFSEIAWSVNFGFSQVGMGPRILNDNYVRPVRSVK